MALITETRTVEGTDLDFYEVRDDAGTKYGIYQDALSAVDVSILTDVDTNGTGTDLQDKMEGYTLSNGQDAFEMYEDSIVNIDDYVSLRQRRLYASDPTGYLESQKVTQDAQQVTLDDHEARITALEP